MFLMEIAFFETKLVHLCEVPLSTWFPPNSDEIVVARAVSSLWLNSSGSTHICCQVRLWLYSTCLRGKIRKAWVTLAPLQLATLFLHLALPLQQLVATYPTLALEPTTLCWWEGGPDIWWQPSLWERQARHGIVRLRKAGYGRNRLLPWGESAK